MRARFLTKVDRQPSGCWEWTARLDKHGYGRFALSGGERRLAHRASWELAHGPVPPGLCVLHRCDNRRCVNPDHLFLGTPKDNTQDMLSKGRCRPRRGDMVWSAKITAADVVRIRTSAGPAKALAQEYGLSLSSVYSIRKRETWTHLP